tara:strand:- start:89 stop:289 length:201 start_codon:yes stop_codon:yes gene_type:complete
MKMNRDVEYYKAIIENLRDFCRETKKEINSIYYGGHSSREQSNFNGQLEMIEKVMRITDRRRKRNA